MLTRIDRDGLSLAELCQLFERLQDGVFFWSRELRLLARNDLACRLYNMDPDFVRPGIDIMDFIAGFPAGTWARNAPPLSWRSLDEGHTRERILADFDTGVDFELRFETPEPRHLIGNRATFQDGLLVTVVTDITHREQNAQALQREKTYLQTIIDNLDEGVGLMDGERCIAFNGRLLDLYGIEPGAVRPGVSAQDFVRASADLKTLPEEEREQAVAERVARATAQEEGTSQFTRELTSGRLLEVTRTALPQRRAVIVVRDVTERAELTRQQAYFAAIIENMAEGVALLDRDGRMIAFNQQALQQYGVEPGRLQPGEHASRFVELHRDLDGLPEEEQARRRAGRLNFALRQDRGRSAERRELGSGRVISVTRIPLDEGALFTYRDVTAEEERKALQERARQEAETASRMKSEFLARMSHELRTPMQGVLGMAAVLAKTGLDEKQQQCLQVIQASGRHMLQLVEDLLTTSIVEADALKLHPEPIEMSQLVGEAVDMVRAQADEQGLSVDLEIDAIDQVAVRADVTRVTQILVNLLANAVRYTRTGGVTVRAGVAPGSADGRRTFRIAVADTGPGIPEEQLEVIFERFRQLGAGQGELNHGVGLGLSVARSLARLMGGDIEVESEPGQGSVFTLRLELPLVAAN